VGAKKERNGLSRGKDVGVCDSGWHFWLFNVAEWGGANCPSLTAHLSSHSSSTSHDASNAAIRFVQCLILCLMSLSLHSRSCLKAQFCAAAAKCAPITSVPSTYVTSHCSLDTTQPATHAHPTLHILEIASLAQARSKQRSGGRLFVPARWPWQRS
jgi:hypothetical protein